RGKDRFNGVGIMERVPLAMQKPIMPAVEKPVAPAAEPTPAAPLSTAPSFEEQVQAAAQVQDLEEKVIGVLKGCYDPEIPVNIYELGLIYGVDVSPTGAVGVRMTLTSPMCPVAGSLPPEVKGKIAAIPGVTSAQVDVVWDPPWNQNMMSEAARL